VVFGLHHGFRQLFDFYSVGDQYDLSHAQGRAW
jgi:hypothetical protein